MQPRGQERRRKRRATGKAPASASDPAADRRARLDPIRRVRKPTAPPARVEKPVTGYDRRKAKRVIEEQEERS